MTPDLTHASSPSRRQVEASRWRLDPSRARIEFGARHFFGLMTVTGHFDRYEGTLDLREQPAARLTIEAASLDSANAKRDRHLRSADFFDVEHHPQIRFVSDFAEADGTLLVVSGRLRAAGREVALTVEATLRAVDGELDLQATAYVDQRTLGMTWSPLGVLRTPTRLSVRGRLVRDAPQPGATPR